jgi:hypothetical protein
MIDWTLLAIASLLFIAGSVFAYYLAMIVVKLLFGDESK